VNDGYAVAQGEGASRLGDARPASVNVHAVSGFVVKELVDAGQDADLVVIGSRGGGFAHLLMGSVGSQVVQHSSCPVVVVPPKR
jgi:nucleotide-binding universal stress UspA family protein